jgi:ribosomal-protein-alanine N-acetyltransferase
MEERIHIDNELYFSPPCEKDIPFYLKYLNDKEISDTTLNIPFPYKETDGDWWINHCREENKQFGHHLNFVIRNKNGEVLGGAGFHGKNRTPPLAHRDEVGYWVARPFWGQGIMSRALPFLLRYGREKRSLSRIEAPVFSFNIASEKVLIKCGFREEGYLRKAYFKNGQYFDSKIFALTY